MQLTVNIRYEQLIKIIRHLPANQRAKIKSDLDNNVAESKSETERADFQKFLLKGPIMTDNQYDAFKENRKVFNQWRSR